MMTRLEALGIYRRHGLLLAQFSVRADVAERLTALESEAATLRSELADAGRALGHGWFVGGVSLSKAIERKCAALESLASKAAP